MPELCLKAINSATGETRRLPLLDFDTLRDKALPSLFGAFAAEDGPVVQYTDDEGDVITISSDTELQDAVAVAREQGLKSLKLHVYPDKHAAQAGNRRHPSPSQPTVAGAPLPPAPAVDPPAIHYGVTCDMSGQHPIVGTRYKLRGENYDLCQAEFDKLSPLEQSQFVKIERPAMARFAAGFPWGPVPRRQRCFRGPNHRAWSCPAAAAAAAGLTSCPVASAPLGPDATAEIHFLDVEKGLGELLLGLPLDDIMMQASIAESLGATLKNPSNTAAAPVAQRLCEFAGAPELAAAVTTILSSMVAESSSAPAATTPQQDAPTSTATPAAPASATSSTTSPLVQLLGAMATPVVGPLAAEMGARAKQAQQSSSSTTTITTDDAPAVHHGVTCDRSGMSPIVGSRFHLEGADYDLCQTEFNKLTEGEKLLYRKIDRPGQRGEFIRDLASADHQPTEPVPEPGSGSYPSVDATLTASDAALEQAIQANLDQAVDASKTAKAAAAAEEESAEEAKAVDEEPPAAAAVAPAAIDKTSSDDGFVVVAPDTVSASDDSAAGGRFAEQLAELAKMGFFDRDSNVALLERYQGRLDRVINFLLDGPLTA